ncbi:MAG: TnpV protein [Acutalibacteraceae bacterium]
MNNISYIRNGDYLIPNITLNQNEQKPLGKYGRMRKEFLKNHRPALWNRMILNGTLYSHLMETDETANDRLEQMMPELMKSAGATEELKASDPMKWVGLMNSLKAQAEEIILNELIYS